MPLHLAAPPPFGLRSGVRCFFTGIFWQPLDLRRRGIKNSAERKEGEMSLGNRTSVAEYQVVGRFESLRRLLLSEEYAHHWEKSLAYWALPNDRRLPLAFLGRTLRDLLHTPFAELSATPGIGRKKLASFVLLLARAANTDPAELPTEVFEAEVNGAPHELDGKSAALDGIDPVNISEVTWSQWRASVVRHGLTGEPLGRLAPSLQSVTRVIWNTPLGAYTSSTLAEIRAMKTYGEKRVRAILETFHAVHALVAGMGAQEHLVVRIMPRTIDQVELWVGRTLQRPGIPPTEEIFSCFISPLLTQVRTDATQQIATLAENRLGVGRAITSVRQAARTMGLTRARVYQLLNEINDIIMVRWPMGRHQSYELRAKFQAEAAASAPPPDLRQFHAAVELFYPGSRRGAAGPLEQAFDAAEQDGELLEASVDAGIDYGRASHDPFPDEPWRHSRTRSAKSTARGADTMDLDE